MITPSVNRITYLVFHDSLLKARSGHCLSSGVLALGPHVGSIGRLLHPLLLSLHSILLQPRIQVSRFGWELVRRGDVGDLLRLLWIVDARLVVGGEGIGSPGRDLSSTGDLPHGP